MKLVWSSYIPTDSPIITFTDIVVSNSFIIRQQILIFFFELYLGSSGPCLFLRLSLFLITWPVLKLPSQVF